MFASGIKISRAAILRGFALALLCGTAIGLQGCVPWPSVAEGGMAEREISLSPSIVTARERFETLARAGAMDYAPGRMLEARELLVRAHREYAGGLRAEAETSVAQAQTRLDEVATILGRKLNAHQRVRAGER